MPPIKRTCKITGREFTITDAEQDLLKKFDVPLPTLHPDERWRQRMQFRNYRFLHNRACDLCKKQTLSVYPADAPFPVHCVKCFYNGDWDPPEANFDFNEKFFPQFKKILMRAPHLAVYLAEPLENSDFNNGATHLKNCYMNFNSNTNEDCYYLYKSEHDKNVVDSVAVFFSEIIYESVYVLESYNIFWSELVSKSMDSRFLFDCSDVQNCFMSAGLRHKQYVFRGRQMTKEDFKGAIKKVDMESWGGIQNLKKEFEEMKIKTPRKSAVSIKCENSTGNFLYGTKDVHNSFVVANAENVWHSSDLAQGKDCMDQTFFNVGGGELVYYTAATGLGAYNIKFCSGCWIDVTNLEYCMLCTNTVKDCFGCMSLHKSRNKILNKQYAPAEYADMVARVRAHMRKTGEYGQFFPVEFSHFAYNESMAPWVFPLTREEAEARGLGWRERPIPQVPQEKIFTEYPETIRDVSDDICEKFLICTKTGRPFRIVKPELAFYKKYNLPLPRVHPDERFYPMFARLGPFTLGERKCSKCGAAIKTVYTDSKLTVYCEPCYQKEIV